MDTSVLVNLLDLDGRNQHRKTVQDDFKRRLGAKDTLILPITTVIETGNHIAHHPNGKHRRDVAEKFAALLKRICDDAIPWQLHSVQWDSAFIQHLIAGASTGTSLVEWAVAEMGCGDLCILAEREAYRQRSGIQDVRVWSLDAHLKAHSA